MRAAPTDAELLDALDRYAWRVWQHDTVERWYIKVDAFGGAVLGEGDTVREALTQALRAVDTSEVV